MNTVTLNEWMNQFKCRFNKRELDYMAVHKAKIILQLKDKETGQVLLHDLEYRSKEAEDLSIASVKREDKNDGKYI